MGTAHIWACSNGNGQEARLLFDTGSAISISQRLADTLQAKRMPSSDSIQGLRDSHTPCTSLVDIQLRPLQGNTNEYIPVRCHIVDNIMSDGYLQTDINLKELSFIKTKSPLADTHLGKLGKIDLLLGVTDVAQAFQGEVVTTGDHKTLATKTLFGRSIEGAIPNKDVQTPVLKVSISDERADDILQRLWEMEDVPGDHSSMTAEELSATTNFTDNYFRDDSGHYGFTLSRRFPLPELGESHLTALKRFHQNERSLKHKGSGSASTRHWKNIPNSIIPNRFQLQN